jgi:hypothetical protein
MMNKQKLWQRSKQKVFFKNDDMDFVFQWILAHQGEGGAAFGECFYTAAQIKDGDPESWFAAWRDLAHRKEMQATQAVEKGHRVSAREAYLHAFTNSERFLLNHLTPDCVILGKKRNGVSSR